MESRRLWRRGRMARVVGWGGPASGVNISVMEVLMKKVLTVVFVFVLGVGVGSFLERKAPVAEAGQEPECAPLLVTGGGVLVQDMNGDGVLDPITEAVRLLSWAFLGAPPPVRPCCAGGSPGGLPDTGQTTCFDRVGEANCSDFAPVSCPYSAQDGFLRTGCPNDENRFTDNGDGTVTDTCTGLVWQKDTGNNGSRLTWCDALIYCSNLSFAGHDDWRLPNVRELQSIVDYGRCNPSIDPVFRALSSFYWSSTSFAVVADLAWDVDFGEGEVRSDFKDSDFASVRAVRSGP